MRFRFAPVACALAVASLFAASASADNFALDTAHTGVTFKVAHMGLSQTFGRFNAVSGSFVVDGPKSSFELAIKSTSVDTGNTARDEHLRGPDFFNVKQYPNMSFKSTSVKAIESGFEVTGDFTMHGVTKSISFLLKGGKMVEMRGALHTGFSTDLVLKRSDFGMDKLKDAIGDEVAVSISFEGVKK